MIALINSLQLLFTLIIFIILLQGLRLKKMKWVLISLWLSSIIVLLQYHASGGEILGSYFGYFSALIYSVNLLILLIAFIYLEFVFIRSRKSGALKPLGGLLAAILITGFVLLTTNLWINATFLETRYPNTPILQVAVFEKLPYCNYKYVFYKVDQDKKISYMCPNYYGLLPSTGQLEKIPALIATRLHGLIQE